MTHRKWHVDEGGKLFKETCAKTLRFCFSFCQMMTQKLCGGTTDEKKKGDGGEKESEIKLKQKRRKE